MRPMDSHRGFVRSAGAMSVMTLLSRVFGYVRDLLLAAVLGAAGSSDAFIIALRIPNLLRRLVGEGALTAAFVPVFSRHLKTEDPEESRRFVGRTFGTLALILAIVSAAGVVLSPLVVRLVAWGFLANPEKWELTVRLNRMMFPYLFFIGLAALAMAVLNSMRSFAVPAFTPVLLNLSIIIAALFVAPRLEEPAYAFAGGVLVGGFLQLSFQIPFIRRRLPFRPSVSFRDPAIRRVGWLMVPGFFGVAVYQINLVVDAQFASFLGDGSVSWLYYGDRVTELVLGVFAISLSTAVLPTLSRHVVDGETARVRSTLLLALRLIAFITIPSTIGLVLLRLPIITVLFQRGEFTRADTIATAGALLGYGLGLLPFSAVKVLAPAFYAHQDTATPVKVAGVCLGIHLLLCASLIGPLRHVGIALATSLTATVNMTGLLWLLRRHIGAGVLGRELLGGTLQYLLCGGIMGLFLTGLTWWMPFPEAGGLGERAGWLALAIGGGAVAYLGAHLLFGGRELKELLAILPIGRRRATPGADGP